MLAHTLFVFSVMKSYFRAETQRIHKIRQNLQSKIISMTHIRTDQNLFHPVGKKKKKESSRNHHRWHFSSLCLRLRANTKISSSFPFAFYSKVLSLLLLMDERVRICHFKRFIIHLKVLINGV